MDFGRKISQLFFGIYFDTLYGGEKNQPPIHEKYMFFTLLEILRVDILLSTLWIGWVYFCSSNAL